MSRLVAFGCSTTYGHGLPDCTIGTGAGPEPSQFAWPVKLAEKLGRTPVNMSKPGAGNTEILWKMFNFDFEPDDLCIVMWSYFTRSELFMYTDDPNGMRIRENRDNPRFYQDEDIFLDHNIIANLLTMDHGARYLNDLNIRSYAYIGPYRVSSKDKIVSGEFYFKTNDRINIPNLDLSFCIRQCVVDQGLDIIHPGVKTHELIAETLYEKINE